MGKLPTPPAPVEQATKNAVGRRTTNAALRGTPSKPHSPTSYVNSKNVSNQDTNVITPPTSAAAAAAVTALPHSPQTPSNTYISPSTAPSSGLISPTTTTSPSSSRKRPNPPVPPPAPLKRLRTGVKWKIFFDGCTIKSSTGCQTTQAITRRNVFIDDAVFELNKLLAQLGFQHVPEHIASLAMATLNDGILPKHIIIDVKIFVGVAQMLAESRTLDLNFDTLRKQWAIRYREWITDNIKVLRIASASALLQTIVEDMTGARFSADLAINAVVTATGKNTADVPLPLFLDAVEIAVKSHVAANINSLV